MNVHTRTTYRVEAFGGLVVTGGTAPLTGAATQRKTLLLLAVLAAAGAQGISREKLLGLFWPNSDTARARHALKQALHILRRDLHDPELVAGTATLRLNPDSIGSDIQEFEDALARGELERAAELYRGPFLDGLYLDGAPEFERWLERERARLAHVYASALERLAVAAGTAGERARAVAWWRRLATTDPLSSRIAIELMKALAAAGDPEAALQQARVHEALVLQELEMPPDPAVAATVERMREELRAGRGQEPRDARAPLPAAAGREQAGESAGECAAEQVAEVPVGVHADPGVAERPAPASPRSPAVSPPPRDGRPSSVTTRRRRTIALVCLLAVALAVFAASRTDGVLRAKAVAPAGPPSVAVLPFVDMSAAPESAYFSDGLSEELIMALSRVDGLRVAARTSSFALRDAKLDARTIGDTLGVATVVEGSVRRDGGRLRVTAQLIDAASGYHIWSGEYDRELKDVFAVQDEIASAIAGALRLTLVDRGGGAAARPVNPEAHDLYLRGTFFRNRLTREAIAKAIEYFDRAIALDSGYALAYAGKASAMGPLFYFRHVPREPGLTEMRAAARRALELDERLGEAHAEMGAIHFYYDWDWPAAERELRRATQLSPGDPYAFHILAHYLRAMARLDEAIAARRRALELDPLSVRAAISLGQEYFIAGQYDRAVEQYRRAIDIDSMNPLLLGLGPSLPAGPGEVYERQGRTGAAVEEYVRVAARRGARPDELSALRRAHAAGGINAFWRRWLQFEERSSSGAPRALRVAAIHARVGDTARAAEWLERAFRERDPGLVYLAVTPDLESVRAHPRVAALLDRMKLAH
jgi:TolB-like protein/DNA-binding SARP family transcriptional activator